MIDQLNRTLGKTVSWLTLLMVLVTFAIVFLRYVLQMGWVWLQESVMYMHAIVFLVAAAYTLQENEHVKIDIFSAKYKKKTAAWVQVFGVIFLLFPMCGLIFYQSFFYVWDSWSIYEGSRNSGGIEAVFLLKTFIPIYSVLLAAQGVSLVAKSFKVVMKK